MTGYIRKQGSQIRLLQKISMSATSACRVEVLSTQHTPEIVPEPQQDEMHTVRLKDEKGHFIPDAIVCDGISWGV